MSGIGRSGGARGDFGVGAGEEGVGSRSGGGVAEAGGDVLHGARGIEGDVLASFGGIVPPVGLMAAVELGADEDGIGAGGEEAFEFGVDIDEVFEDFEGGDEGGGVVRVGFEAAGEDVLGVAIGEAEVEAAVAHHADEDTVTAAEIEAGGIGGDAEDPGDGGGEIGGEAVSFDGAGVHGGDGGGVGLGKPLGFVGLDEVASRALVVGGVPVIEDLLAEN